MNKLFLIATLITLGHSSFASETSVGAYVSGVQNQQYTVSDAQLPNPLEVLVEEYQGYKVGYVLTSTTAQGSVGVLASVAPESDKVQVQLLMGVPVSDVEFAAVSRNSAYFLELPAFRPILKVLATDKDLLARTLAQTDPYNRLVHVLRINNIRYAYMPFEFVPNVAAEDVDALLSLFNSTDRHRD